MNSLDFSQFQKIWQPLVEAQLERLMAGLSLKGCPGSLSTAMKYSVLNGGKRLRPLALLAAMRALDGKVENGIGVGCALEMVHCYSLIHDDLPAMDNDDFRRGKPSCHRACGEAQAILAGDALLTHAFCVLVKAVDPSKLFEVVGMLAKAAGPWGMVGGQADDIEAWQYIPSIEEVEWIHFRKTGALFSAALALGGVLADAKKAQIKILERSGKKIGLAFQIVNDLLAWEGQNQRLGRPLDSDKQKKRRTYPLVIGSDASRQRIVQLVDEVKNDLTQLGPSADVLISMVQSLGAQSK